MAKKRSYHFSLGNSSEGPVGCCARIIAKSEAEAVEKLKDLLPEAYMLQESEGDLDYFQAYFNANAVSEKDIDEVDDIEEGDCRGDDDDADAD